MEPAHLTPDDQQLADLLRQPPLPDDRFSRGVMAALPIPRSRSSNRPAFIIAGAAAGLAIAATQIGSWSNFADGVQYVGASLAPATVVLELPMFWIGLIAAALSVGYALLATASGTENRLK